jgi:hypothetical protein
LTGRGEELPDEIDSSDMAEYMYANLYMTELTWPSLFFGTWAGFEPDVILFHRKLKFRILILSNYDLDRSLIAHYSLSLGEGTSLTQI